MACLQGGSATIDPIRHGDLEALGHALRAYESYRRFLATELGADPSVQTQDLHLRLLRSSGGD